MQTSKIIITARIISLVKAGPTSDKMSPEHDKKYLSYMKISFQL